MHHAWPGSHWHARTWRHRCADFTRLTLPAPQAARPRKPTRFTTALFTPQACSRLGRHP
jgi:hypothetical protein